MCLREEDLEKAETLFQKAVTLTGNNAWPYFYLGRVRIRRGNIEGAIDALRDGEDFVYNQRSPYRNRRALTAIRNQLAQAYVLSDELPAAELVLDDLVKRDEEGNPEALRTYIALMLKKTDVATAQKEFEKRISVKVQNRYDRCLMHLFIGMFYLGSGQAQRANEEFAEAHRADKRNVYVLMRWADNLHNLAKGIWVEEPEIALIYAQQCASLVRQILSFDSDNAVALRLQEALYVLGGIEV